MKIKCPACSTVLSIPESAAGKTVKCPCGKHLRAPGGTPAQKTPPRPTPAMPPAAKPTAPAAKPVAPATPAAPGGDLFDELSEADFQSVAAVTRPGVKAPPPKMDAQTRKLLEDNDPDAGKRRGSKKAGRSKKASGKRSSYAGPLAGPWTRFVASLIDGIFINTVLFVSGFVGATLGAASVGKIEDEVTEAEFFQILQQFFLVYGISIACGVLITAIIFTIMMMNSGQTIGKKLCGIRVVDASTRQIPAFAQGVLIRSWLKNVMYFVPLLALVDILMIFGDENQCLHDKMANTIVIKD